MLFTCRVVCLSSRGSSGGLPGSWCWHHPSTQARRRRSPFPSQFDGWMGARFERWRPFTGRDVRAGRSHHAFCSGSSGCANKCSEERRSGRSTNFVGAMTREVRPELLRTSSGVIAVRASGSGPAIVFLHGNSCSSRAFQRQLESELAHHFRLIAIDMPGHGDSPAATRPESTYTLPGYAAAVVAAVDALDAHSAIFVGWSLGGHMLLEASDRLLQATGFVLMGAPPVATLEDFSRATTSDPALAAAFREVPDGRRRPELPFPVFPVWDIRASELPGGLSAHRQASARRSEREHRSRGAARRNPRGRSARPSPWRSCMVRRRRS